MKTKSIRGSVAVLAALITATAGLNAFAGEKGGNGGDAVLCSQGTYSLDYVVGRALGTWELLDAGSVDASLDRIQSRLEVTVPSLGESFAEFRNLLANHSDYLKPRIWIPSRLQLKPISDEHLDVELPPTCKKIVQAVRRTGVDPIEYTFDQEVLSTLSRAPLQASFLYVHEWLWDYVDDARDSRAIDAYLHSAEFQTDDDERILETLQRLGLKGRFETRSEIAAGVSNDQPQASDPMTQITRGSTITVTRDIEVKPWVPMVNLSDGGEFSDVDHLTYSARYADVIHSRQKSCALKMKGFSETDRVLPAGSTYQVVSVETGADYTEIKTNSQSLASIFCTTGSTIGDLRRLTRGFMTLTLAPLPPPPPPPPVIIH